MAHFAKLDENNFVIDVNVVNNDDVLNLPFPASESVGIQFLTDWSGGYSRWLQTSYNANFRKRYAQIGDFYDNDRDAFIPPQPYSSWLLNESTCLWEPPVPYPTDRGTPGKPKRYLWDEPTTSWVVIESE